MKAKIPGGWRQNALRHSFISYTWVGKRMIPYIQITPRFYLFEFDAVLAALKKHYQVDARG